MSGPESWLMIQPCWCLEFFRCVKIFRCIWFNSRDVGLNQPAILASIAYWDRSANIRKLGAWIIHLFQCTWRFLHHNTDLALTIWIWTTDISSGLFPGTPQIASFLAKRHLFQAHLELHPPRPSVTLLLYFPVILLNFILYLPLYTSVYILQLHCIIINMEPTVSQVTNHYWQKNEEAHHERALTCGLKETANHHCRMNDWTWNPAFEYSVGDC